jgi:D-alanyl-D-alanine endopeptidase (penicillin-binding protein 7)
MRTTTRGQKRWLLILPVLLFACPISQAAPASTPAHVQPTKSQCAKAHHGRKAHRKALALTGKPDIKSSSVFVVDETNALVLLSKQSTVPAPIASITKLMTALVVLDAKQSLDEVLEVTHDDRAVEKGGRSRLAIGTKLSRGDLLHLALMSSENRAAHCVARNYPGGMPAMLRAMNAKATAIGMKSAQFSDPTGLSSENVASPEDLAKLVMAAAQHPTIRDFSTDTDYSVRVGRGEVEFRNTNALVSNPDWDIIVQKTGFTNEAGKCLVMKTVIQDHPVVIVLLDSFGKYTRVADARRIRKWIEAGPYQSHLARADS